MKALLAALFVLLFCAQVHAAGRSIVFYRVGDGGQEAWALLKDYFEAKGYGVTVVQGETTIEKHVEKINRINRGRGSVFLALELLSDGSGRAMVAASDARMGTGRIPAVDEAPARFKAQSDSLAAHVAASFDVRVKRLPLFPLLGVNMPGIAARLQFDQGETMTVIAKVYKGVEDYFSERTKME